jgi:alkylated DNA repair dioxygenase AlkB
MDWQSPAIPDADLRYAPQWLTRDAADALFESLRENVAWERHRIRLFGREIDSPRLSCWIGDADAGYTYSRTRYEPRPWPDALRPVRERLREELSVDFNGVLANLYRDGADSMGWHSDDEPEIDPRVPIASLSLGATRRFALRRRDDTKRKFSIELARGNLLTMGSDMQRYWQHALPRTARESGARINLTFRRIRGTVTEAI